MILEFDGTFVSATVDSIESVEVLTAEDTGNISDYINNFDSGLISGISRRGSDNALVVNLKPDPIFNSLSSKHKVPEAVEA